MNTENKESHNKTDNLSIEDMQFIFLNINNWISQADQKISIILGIISLISTLMFPSLINSCAKSNCFKFMLILSIILMALAMFFCIYALAPRFYGKSKDKDFHHPSIFYADIALFKDAENYRQCMTDCTKKKYKDLVLDEIFYNSKICAKRFNLLRCACWTGFAGFILILIIYIIWK